MSRTWQRSGYPSAHRRARHLVMTQNQLGNRGRCTVALDGTRECPRHAGQRCDVCTVTATEAHHVYGRAVTGDDARHMTASCRPCNVHLGEPMAEDPVPTPRSRW